MTTVQHQKKTIRLVYPQWQGGSIDRWVPEVEDPDEVARGYALGAQLLNFLAPLARNQETWTVPIEMEKGERTIVDGVWDRDALVRQTKAALAMLEVAQPDRIVTLGGECSASVAPFTYLARRYAGDVAMVWIDAHPDITLPGDEYAGYHAMAAAACMGFGESKLMSLLPARIAPENILMVGLRDWEREEIRVRQQEYGIDFVTSERLERDSYEVIRWLQECPASHVLVHFDMDVLDPAEILAAVGAVPGGMSLASVTRLIRDIAAEKELVGLTVAEPMPRTAIRLRAMLAKLPLMQD